MKKKILISLILLSYNLTIKAQIYGTVMGSSGNNNVGIGTTSPTEKLDIDGSLNLRGGQIFAAADGSNTFFANAVQHIFRAGSSGSYEERMRITSVGNVGVGTNNPTSKLEIYNTAQTGHLLLSANDNPNADFTRIDIDFKVANQGHTIGRIASFYDESGSNGSGGLRFYTRNRGDLVENIRISSIGNVGIGTNNPWSYTCWSKRCDRCSYV